VEAMEKMIKSYSVYKTAEISEKACNRFGHRSIAKEFDTLYSSL
jgi:hypothetical protein